MEECGEKDAQEALLFGLGGSGTDEKGGEGRTGTPQ